MTDGCSYHHLLCTQPLGREVKTGYQRQRNEELPERRGEMKLRQCSQSIQPLGERQPMFCLVYCRHCRAWRNETPRVKTWHPVGDCGEVSGGGCQGVGSS
jgi:hypothetical protein